MVSDWSLRLLPVCSFFPTSTVAGIVVSQNITVSIFINVSQKSCAESQKDFDKSAAEITVFQGGILRFEKFQMSDNYCMVEIHRQVCSNFLKLSDSVPNSSHL